TGKMVAAPPLTCEILNFFDRWRSPASAFGRFSEYSPSSILSSIESLAQHSMLERPGSRFGQPDHFGEWSDWNPAAGFFHFSTKNPIDSERENSSKVYRSLVHKAERTPMPRPIKRYPGARTVLLSEPKKTGEFPQVLLKRRTWRRFSSRALDVNELSTLLGLTWRVQRWERIRG